MSSTVHSQPRARRGRAVSSRSLIAIVAFTGTLIAACSPSAASPAATAGATAAAVSTPSVTSTPSAIASAASSPTTAASTAGSAGTALTCATPATPTISQTEGPYYRAGAPQTNTLVEAGVTGTLLTLAGSVVDTNCQPLANAKVDVWQADANGDYDNSGYRLRGYVLTDATGKFTIETIIPANYGNRTAHIHVKVTPAGGPTLTTQLYLPNRPNESDSIYDPSLLVSMTPSGNGFVGAYTFVLAMAPRAS